MELLCLQFANLVVRLSTLPIEQNDTISVWGRHLWLSLDGDCDKCQSESRNSTSALAQRIEL